MANKDTKTNFEAWVAKATQRLEAKRTPQAPTAVHPIS